MRISVPDMTCGHCRAKIETALMEADEGAALDFDMEARVVTVDSVLAPAEAVEVVQGAGYTPALID